MRGEIHVCLERQNDPHIYILQMENKLRNFFLCLLRNYFYFIDVCLIFILITRLMIIKYNLIFYLSCSFFCFVNPFTFTDGLKLFMNVLNNFRY